MPWFEHKSCRIRYDVSGNGPALLFMHGLSADRQQAQQSLQDLTGYQLITLDMPGHGDSLLPGADDPSFRAGFLSYTEIAGALLDFLGVDRVIAGGISMGSGIALSLALAQPKRVEALLLVRPAWLDAPGTPHLDIIAQMGNWIFQGGADMAKHKLASHPVYVDALIDNPNCAASIKGALERPQAIEAASVLPDLVADQPFNRMSALEKCRTPALVLGNNADPLHPVVIARAISGALSHGEYVQVPPKYLEPEAHQAAVLNEIQNFLTRVSGPIAAETQT